MSSMLMRGVDLDTEMCEKVVHVDDGRHEMEKAGQTFKVMLYLDANGVCECAKGVIGYT